MTCDEMRQIIQSRQPWESSHEERLAVRRHFEECPHCNEYVHALPSPRDHPGAHAAVLLRELDDLQEPQGDQ